MNKREFLKSISLAGAVTVSDLSKISKWVDDKSHLSPDLLAADEDFWAKIRSQYKLKKEYINLENGYYCFMPKQTLDKFIKQVQEVNFQGSWYMRNHRFNDNIEVRKKLAALVDCSHEEVVLTRNTTESIDTVVAGYDWKPGDEAVMANQDYGAMLDMFAFQSRRYGLKQTRIDVPLHPRSDEEIVDVYARAITEKTRLLMVCHMINITGHILPIKKIAAMAHSKNVDVVVDGAHCVGHFKYSINDLGVDYYASSLHKWLSTPLGAGLLYVRKNKIQNLWQLFGDMGYQDDDIRKLNHIGTCPVHTDLTVMDAIDFYYMIGAERKEARLRYLQNYWTSKVRGLSHIILNTPSDPARSCGIANVGVKNMKPADLAKTLLEKYKIFTVAIDGVGVHGCRITPNVYTTTKELDQFVLALNQLASA